MFNIDKRIRKEIIKKISEIDWDANVTRVADRAVRDATSMYYDTISERVDRLVSNTVYSIVATKLDKQLNDPKYLKQVVTSLRELQLKDK